MQLQLPAEVFGNNNNNNNNNSLLIQYGNHTTHVTTSCHAGQHNQVPARRPGITAGFRTSNTLPQAALSNQPHEAYNPVSIHQMAPPERGSTHPVNSLLLIYPPRKNERPSWLTCSGRFTHISGHPLQEERRTGTVRRPETSVPPLC